jgi:hypothetical protein
MLERVASLGPRARWDAEKEDFVADDGLVFRSKLNDPIPGAVLALPACPWRTLWYSKPQYWTQLVAEEAARAERNFAQAVAADS